MSLDLKIPRSKKLSIIPHSMLRFAFIPLLLVAFQIHARAHEFAALKGELSIGPYPSGIHVYFVATNASKEPIENWTSLIVRHNVLVHMIDAKTGKTIDTSGFRSHRLKPDNLGGWSIFSRVDDANKLPPGEHCGYAFTATIPGPGDNKEFPRESDFLFPGEGECLGFLSSLFPNYPSSRI